jgi:hypothetical protein
MRCRLAIAAVVSVAALVAASVALADGPTLGAFQGGDGVLASPGLRYVAIWDGMGTVVAGIGTEAGEVESSVFVPGSFGIPRITLNGSNGGLSPDGRTLVLADTNAGQPLKQRSSFAILDLNRYRLRRLAHLHGDFSFDALSPSGRFLYLIQHVSRQDMTRYVVRAFDTRSGRLLPQRIADRTQREWVMQGYPMARASSADGRWVYTLYQNPGGYPFVHALDAVRARAHCIGLPWSGADQAALYNLRLSVQRGGKALALDWRSGRHFLTIDTRTWRVSTPSSGFPWWTLGAGAGGALGAVALALLGRRRLRARSRLEQPVAAAW